ncbi:MAG: hypothetical protein HXY40_10430 [Chloroflexi bacterium]|nr:hypothetical protein [Chloroflexota bacterium]
MLSSPLPSNAALTEYSQTVDWQEIERQKRIFNQMLKDHAGEESLPLAAMSEALGAPVKLYYEAPVNGANVVLGHVNGHPYVLGSAVSKRYRSGKSFMQSIVPYNLNPSVNHTNIGETDNPGTRMRALGAEIELGLLHRDGRPPSEAEMQQYMRTYQDHARRLGITPHVDREACQYQIETHIAPSVGYYKTRNALQGIMTALMLTCDETGLQTAIMSSYPTESDFHLTEDPKVQTAVDLMTQVNAHFPEYVERLAAAQQRYFVGPDSLNVVQMFRIHGCHIHLDLAGRSEALGLLTFYTMLRSATAAANAAVLKGGPFVNGTCDSELLCTREYLRRTTVTGRYLEMPISPHFTAGGLEKYAGLLLNERANSTGRAMLCEEGLGEPISAMHNGVGRVRSDLQTSRRICTVESTGMPANLSPARMAAVLTDFEFSHAVIEQYFRKYGCDLEPMYNDRAMWSVLGPLDSALFAQLHDLSDRQCSDMLLRTATGEQISLAEFYEKKRRFMHRALDDVMEITPRDIDDVYTSLTRMMEPPSGHAAQTIEQFIYDPKLKSTGNWGRIMRDAFVAEGGTPGKHEPDAVLKVVNRINDALRVRFLQT